MKVQQVCSNVNFNADKRRFIELQSQRELGMLLRKMDEETVYKANEYSFESTRTKRLDLFDNNKNQRAELIDTRMNLKKYPKNKEFEKETLLTIGKTELVINNGTGQIVDYYKPFWISWTKVMDKVKSVLTDFNKNYNNPQLVKKNKFSIKGYTKKGYEMLSKIKVK